MDLAVQLALILSAIAATVIAVLGIVNLVFSPKWPLVKTAIKTTVGKIHIYIEKRYVPIIITITATIAVIITVRLFLTSNLSVVLTIAVMPFLLLLSNVWSLIMATIKNTVRNMWGIIKKRYVAILITIAAMIAVIMTVRILFTANISKVLPIVIISFLISFPIMMLLTVIGNNKTVRKVAIYISERYTPIVSTIAVTIAIIVVVTIKDLPDANTVEQTARKVGNNIAARNMASLRSSMDNMIHTLISYQNAPDATRNRIYEDALRQAADKGYVFYIPQRDYYITAYNWMGDERVLTEEEKYRIKNSLDDILKRTNKQDQISLMNEVLRDIRVTEELWKPKEREVDLSEVDLIGVVGSYIGELLLN